MKNQALFSSTDKIKKLNCRLLQFLFGTLKVTGQMDSLSKIVLFTKRKKCCDMINAKFC